MQGRQFAVAADQRCSRRRPLGGRGGRLEHAPRGNRLPLPLSVDRLDRFVGDDRVRCPVRPLTDENPVRGGRRLQTSGSVHDVTGEHALTLGRRPVESDDRLARSDRDPSLQIKPRLPVVQVGDRVADGECGTHAALRVVAVRHWCAEHRHDGVADELLHDAAMRLNYLLQA